MHILQITYADPHSTPASVQQQQRNSRLICSKPLRARELIKDHFWPLLEKDPRWALLPEGKKLGKEAKSKACWDHSHMAVPDWECLLETTIVAWLPWDVGRGRRDQNVDVFGGVRACACREGTLCQNRLLKTNAPTLTLMTVMSYEISFLTWRTPLRIFTQTD